jgi:hypothetical protein
MPRTAAPDGPSALGGVDALIAAASRLAADSPGEGSAAAVRQLGEQYAFIRLADLRRPLRFLRQMAGAPPVELGTAGFRHDLVDDLNPARHYIAFVVVGYWLPRWAAVGVLWLWEVASLIRYWGKWSWPDIASGYLGIRHGRLVRRYGAVILPSLIASELAEPEPHAKDAKAGAAVLPQRTQNR